MRLMTITFRIVLLMGIVACSSCDDGLGPAADLSLFVAVSPDVVRLGDTVEITGAAYNGASTSIDAGVSCEPGIKFFVRDPQDVETDLYADLLFICPRLDSQDIMPGETDVERWQWVPETAGDHRVSSAVVVRDGPVIRSEPALVSVLDPS